MFVQPVLVYETDGAALRRAYERAMSRKDRRSHCARLRACQRYWPPLLARSEPMKVAGQGDPCSA